MNSLKVVILLVGLMVLSTGALLAGDNAQIDVIGFSDDGNYFAFEEYGYQDGSGFPYSSIFIIDTVKNTWAAKPVRIVEENEDMDMQSVSAKNRRAAVSVLREHNLDNVPACRAIIADYAEDGPMTSNKRKSFDFAVEDGSYWLNITEVDAPQDGGDMYGMTPQALTLKLSGSKNAVLQDDEGLVPNTRSLGSAMNYDISGLYVSKDFSKIVVIVGYHRPDFEGPSKRYIAISGTL